MGEGVSGGCTVRPCSKMQWGAAQRQQWLEWFLTVVWQAMGIGSAQNHAISSVLKRHLI